MTRIWLINWHFQSRITLWYRHKSTNVSMGLCWQMPKFIIYNLWSIYFNHHLPLKSSIGKRRKQSCTPNSRRGQIRIRQITSIFFKHNFLFQYLIADVENFSKLYNKVIFCWYFLVIKLYTESYSTASISTQSVPPLKPLECCSECSEFGKIKTKIEDYSSYFNFCTKNLFFVKMKIRTKP